MLDIIGHFFVLYPLITLNKETQLLKTKSNVQKLVLNLAILFVATILTRMYLNDESHIKSHSASKGQNLYQLFEMKPQDF